MAEDDEIAQFALLDSLIFLLLHENLDKSTVNYIIYVFFLFAKFHDNQISVTRLSITYLKCKFL